MYKHVYILLVFVVGMFFHLQAQTQVFTDSIHLAPNADTSVVIQQLNKQSSELIKRSKLDSALIIAYQALYLAQKSKNVRDEASALYNVGEVYISKGKYNRALSSFLRSLKVKKNLHDNRFSVNLYYSLSNSFARMKMYPQALKYYYKMINAYEKGQNKSNYLYVDVHEKPDIDSLDTNEEADTTIQTQSNLSNINDSLQNSLFQQVINADDSVSEKLLTDSVELKTAEPTEIDAENIIDCFDDGKHAVAYGLMIHVKQPKPGTRKVFSKISDVGHMFVTLVKINADSTTVSRSFGFYPKKDNPLSATPLVPSTTSVFKDDAAHDWDEVLGKFISARKFRKILRTIKEYQHRLYDLNSSNCTDFGLDIAAIANIRIKETSGNWLLGKGNNPAHAGQSILERKVKDEDKNNRLGLIIFPKNQ